MRLLVIEGDAATRKALAAFMRESGWAVDEAGDAAEAFGLAETYPYDALLVDTSLPEGRHSGLSLLHRLRECGFVPPVLLVSDDGSLEDRLEAFGVGADDYIVKPYYLAEVGARLLAAVRRASRTATERSLRHGTLEINLDAHSVSAHGRMVHLTRKEFAILELLAQNPGRLFSRDEIIERIWDLSFAASSSIVDVYVCNLRKKLDVEAIETVRGLGYRFNVHLTPSDSERQLAERQQAETITA